MSQYLDTMVVPVIIIDFTLNIRLTDCIFRVDCLSRTFCFFFSGECVPVYLVVFHYHHDGDDLVKTCVHLMHINLAI